MEAAIKKWLAINQPLTCREYDDLQEDLHQLGDALEHPEIGTFEKIRVVDPDLARRFSSDKGVLRLSPSDEIQYAFLSVAERRGGIVPLFVTLGEDELAAAIRLSGDKT